MEKYAKYDSDTQRIYADARDEANLHMIDGDMTVNDHRRTYTTLPAMTEALPEFTLIPYMFRKISLTEDGLEYVHEFKDRCDYLYSHNTVVQLTPDQFTSWAIEDKDFIVEYPDCNDNPNDTQSIDSNFRDFINEGGFIVEYPECDDSPIDTQNIDFDFRDFIDEYDSIVEFPDLDDRSYEDWDTDSDIGDFAGDVEVFYPSRDEIQRITDNSPSPAPCA